ncbi:MAG: 6,7-dimethyl-8-ribityllumazine synthase [Candidatus Rokubacteria bacterium]|nr:6,7-dimethyl-8-ribityllumazine synthase [Candidatus Rokubacteria bacterium]
MAGRAPRRQLAGAPGSRRFVIVAARFNESITKRLLDGALETFRAHGVPAAAVEVHWVPGSFELPPAALHLARTGRFAAVVCLGVVIRGQTPHFEHVARETAAGIREAAMRTGVPVSFGVVTALNEEQAWDRAGGTVGNRGEEAALAALEMAEWVRELKRPRRGPGGAVASRRR